MMRETMKPRVERTKSFPVSIFIAGDYNRAVCCAREYCDTASYCVTVTQTRYVYNGGEEAGVIIGLINYPRFPKSQDVILAHATALGNTLLKVLGQQSFSIQTPDDTIWYSYRTEDTACA